MRHRRRENARSEKCDGSPNRHSAPTRPTSFFTSFFLLDASTYTMGSESNSDVVALRPLACGGGDAHSGARC